MLNRINAYLKAVDDLNTGANVRRSRARLSWPQGLGRLVHLNRSSAKDSMVTNTSRRNAAASNPRYSRVAALNRGTVSTDADRGGAAGLYTAPTSVKRGAVRKISQGPPASSFDEMSEGDDVSESSFEDSNSSRSSENDSNNSESDISSFAGSMLGSDIELNVGDAAEQEHEDEDEVDVVVVEKEPTSTTRTLLNRVDSSVVRAKRMNSDHASRAGVSNSLRSEYTSAHYTAESVPSGSEGGGEDEVHEGDNGDAATTTTTEQEVRRGVVPEEEELGRMDSINSLDSTDTGLSMVSLRVLEITKRESQNSFVNEDLAAPRPSLTLPKRGRRRVRPRRHSASTASTSSTFSAYLSPQHGRTRRRSMAASMNRGGGGSSSSNSSGSSSTSEQDLDNWFSRSETDIAAAAELYRLRSSMKPRRPTQLLRQSITSSQGHQTQFGGVVVVDVLPVIVSVRSPAVPLEQRMVSGHAEWDAISEASSSSSSSEEEEENEDEEGLCVGGALDWESLVNAVDDDNDDAASSDSDESSDWSSVSGGPVQRWDDWWDWFDETCELFKGGEFDSWGDNVDVPSHLCELTCPSEGVEWHPTAEEFRVAGQFFDEFHAANLAADAAVAAADGDGDDDDEQAREHRVVAARVAADVAQVVGGNADSVATAAATENATSCDVSAPGPAPERRRRIRFASSELVMGLSAPYVHGGDVLSDDEYADTDSACSDSSIVGVSSGSLCSGGDSEDYSDDGDADGDDDTEGKTEAQAASRAERERLVANIRHAQVEDWDHGPML